MDKKSDAKKSKAKKSAESKATQGKKHCMMIELEPDDHSRLVELVESYRTRYGDALRANKTMVIRLLIRHADLTDLPPLA